MKSAGAEATEEGTEFRHQAARRARVVKAREDERREGCWRAVELVGGGPTRSPPLRCYDSQLLQHVSSHCCLIRCAGPHSPILVRLVFGRRSLAPRCEHTSVSRDLQEQLRGRGAIAAHSVMASISISVRWNRCCVFGATGKWKHVGTGHWALLLERGSQRQRAERCCRVAIICQQLVMVVGGLL